MLLSFMKRQKVLDFVILLSIFYFRECAASAQKKSHENDIVIYECLFNDKKSNLPEINIDRQSYRCLFRNLDRKKHMNKIGILTSKNLLLPTQHGFMGDRSCLSRGICHEGPRRLFSGGYKIKRNTINKIIYITRNHRLISVSFVGNDESSVIAFIFADGIEHEDRVNKKITSDLIDGEG